MAALLWRAAASWPVRLALTLAILAWLGTRFDMTEALRAVVAVDGAYLALVLGLVAVDRLVMIWRWVLLLRASGVPVQAPQAARIFLVSSFVGSFLPAGVGGDAARTYAVAQHTTQGSEALATVAVDRLLGMLSLATMSLVGLVAWTPGAGSVGRVALAAAVMTGACTAVFWADRLVGAVMPERHRHGALGRRLVRVSEAVGRYRNRGGVLLHVMVWSLVVQVLRITQAYLLGRGLGIGVPFPYYLLFMPVGLLMLMLPISVSGFGVPQGVIVWLLQPAGVAAPQSFALSTLIVVTGLAGNLPGLVLWLGRSRRAG